MARNIGTLITAPIRPNDSRDRIATAYSSEIKGGLHTVMTIQDRDNIIPQRREWGMLCYVVNENNYYILKYGHYNNNITDNRNWIKFDYNTNGFWSDPVIELRNNPPQNAQNGDRYLIVPPATGIWSGKDNNIAQWNDILNRWEYTQPINGMTIRIKNNNNKIYRYDGDYPSGLWVEENNNTNINIEPLYQYIDINIYDFNTNNSEFIASSIQNINELSPRHIYVLNYNYNLTSNYDNVRLKINSTDSYFIIKCGQLNNDINYVSSNDFSQSNTYYFKWTGHYFILYDNNPYTSDFYKYSNPLPSKNIGSLKENTLFDNVNIYDVLDSIISPDKFVTDIYDFTCNIPENIESENRFIEVGTPIGPGNLIFSFKTFNESFIKNNGIYIEDLTNNLVISDNISNFSNTTTVNITYSIVYNSKNEHVFRASAQKIDGSIIRSNTYKFKWVYKIYYGTSNNDINSENDIFNLQNSVLSDTCNGLYMFDRGGYKFIAIEFNEAQNINNIIDANTNLCIVMADYNDEGYSYPINSRLYCKTLTVTNQHGITITYCIFRTKYIINSNISMIIQ